MGGLTRALGRAARSSLFAEVATCSALAAAVVVAGVASPFPSPPTSLLVLVCALLGLSLGDETMNTGVLVGLVLVALDQVGLGLGQGEAWLLVVAPWLTFRAACRFVAGQIRRFHGWQPARPPLGVWPWPGTWLVAAVVAVAAAWHHLAPASLGLAWLATIAALAATAAAVTAAPGRPPTFAQALRGAVTLALAEGAALTLVHPADAGSRWPAWTAVGCGTVLGAGLGLALGRSGSARRALGLGLHLAYVPATLGWLVPALAAAAGVVYALLGGEGGPSAGVAAIGLLLLIVGACTAATPVVWGLEYGLVDWLRRRRVRPGPVPGLAHMRLRLVGRRFPSPGGRSLRLDGATREGRQVTVDLEGAVCLNERSYHRQDPAHWLCPIRGILEVSGELHEGESRLVVREEDGGWIRSLPTPRDPSFARRGLAVGLRIAVGALLTVSAAELTRPRLEARYSPACRTLYRDPGTLRAPLVSAERCVELLSARAGGARADSSGARSR